MKDLSADSQRYILKEEFTRLPVVSIQVYSVEV